MTDLFLRGVSPSPIHDADDSGPPVAYGLHTTAGCALEATRAVVADGQWGFFQSAGSLALRTSVVAGQRMGVGASNGASPMQPLELEGVTYTDNASDRVLVDPTATRGRPYERLLTGRASAPRRYSTGPCCR